MEIENKLKVVKPGMRLKFRMAAPGEIFDVVKPVYAGDEICSARLFVSHEDGTESYHTYRYDGMSHYHESHDIVEFG